MSARNSRTIWWFLKTSVMGTPSTVLYDDWEFSRIGVREVKLPLLDSDRLTLHYHSVGRWLLFAVGAVAAA